jgi:hypothetical protein
VTASRTREVGVKSSGPAGSLGDLGESLTLSGTRIPSGSLRLLRVVLVECSVGRTGTGLQPPRQWGGSSWLPR